MRFVGGKTIHKDDFIGATTVIVLPGSVSILSIKKGFNSEKNELEV